MGYQAAQDVADGRPTDMAGNLRGRRSQVSIRRPSINDALPSAPNAARFSSAGNLVGSLEVLPEPKEGNQVRRGWGGGWQKRVDLSRGRERHTSALTRAMRCTRIASYMTRSTESDSGRYICGALSPYTRGMCAGHEGHGHGYSTHS